MSFLNLIRPKWNHPDEAVRLSFVEKTENQTILAKVAGKEPLWLIRIVAVKKLKNQILLEQIAMHDENVSVRIGAVLKLKNHVVLEEIKKNDKKKDVRETAANRLKRILEYKMAKTYGIKIVDCRICNEELHLPPPKQEGYQCQKCGWSPICESCIRKGSRCGKCGWCVFVVMM